MSVIRHRSIWLTTISILILSVVVGFVAWSAFQRLELRNCVYYLTGDVAEYSRKIDALGLGEGEWYILDAGERTAILSELPSHNCSTFSSRPSDLENRTMEIAVKRHMTSASFEVLVWSKGFDNVSGTEDDIMPFADQRPPIQK